MFATFEEFLARYSATRVKQFTDYHIANKADAIDAGSRLGVIKSALQVATDEIRGYATIPDPTPAIVRRWCLILAQRNLCEGIGSTAIYTEIDKEASDRVYADLERCKDGGMFWETKADQEIPSGPVTDAQPTVSTFKSLCSTSDYALRRSS